eukprot:UN29870
MRPYRAVRLKRFRHTAMGVTEGLFISEGEQWKKQRKVVAQFFTPSQLKKYRPVLKERCEKLIEILKKRDLGAPFLIADTFNRLTCDIIARIGFGWEMKAVEGDPEALKYCEAMCKLFKMFQRRYATPFDYWKLPFMEYFTKETENVHYLQSKIKKTLETASKADNSMLHKLLEENDWSNAEIVDNIITLFVAGTDTTSHEMTWCAYVLGS